MKGILAAIPRKHRAPSRDWAGSNGREEELPKTGLGSPVIWNRLVESRDY